MELKRMELIFRCDKCNDFETSEISSSLNHKCSNKAKNPVPEKPAAAKPEEGALSLKEKSEILCNTTQLLSGWSQDGTAWTAFDEECRQGIIKMLFDVNKEIDRLKL